MMAHIEIEQKFHAGAITPPDFIAYVRSQYNKPALLAVGGVDTFYGDDFFPLRFVRRRGNTLTFKGPTSGRYGVQVRSEIDLELLTTRGPVSEFLGALGLTLRFSLGKQGYVLRTPELIYSYYSVDELGSFIEIEAVNHKFSSRIQALDAVRLASTQMCDALGPMVRVKQSLCELYHNHLHEGDMS